MSRHPFKKDQRVLCIRAPERGIPVKEGHTYTVKRAFFGNQSHAEACTPGMENTPGVSLVEVGGYFVADRFRAIPED